MYWTLSNGKVFCMTAQVIQAMTTECKEYKNMQLLTATQGSKKYGFCRLPILKTLKFSNSFACKSEAIVCSQCRLCAFKKPAGYKHVNVERMMWDHNVIG